MNDDNWPKTWDDILAFMTEWRKEQLVIWQKEIAFLLKLLDFYPAGEKVINKMASDYYAMIINIKRETDELREERKV